MHITVRIPRSSGSENGLQADEQGDALLQLHAMFVAAAQAVEELVGREPGGIAVFLTVGDEHRVQLEKGVTLLIGLEAISEPDERGMRT